MVLRNSTASISKLNVLYVYTNLAYQIQVLALRKEAPCVGRLRQRALGARDKPSVSRISVQRVRYNRHMGCVFACSGPVVEVRARHPGLLLR